MLFRSSGRASSISLCTSPGVNASVRRLPSLVTSGAVATGGSGSSKGAGMRQVYVACPRPASGSIDYAALPISGTTPNTSAATSMTIEAEIDQISVKRW